MNRSKLKTGYAFSVSEKQGTYTMKKVIGEGGSCVVYLADFTDSHGITTEHIIKEYYPKNIAVVRDETGALCAETEEAKEAFDNGLMRFQAGYKKQSEIRRIVDLKNSTSNIQDILKANGTEYIDMTCFNGSDYADAEEKTLYDLMRRMKALTTVIKSYHDNGFLHLDIKPENIFVMPETPETVMLFDFDSVTEREKAAGNIGLSYTEIWAAPEQINPYRRKTICEATDLFAIGEIIFVRLMGRHSVNEDRRYFSKYEYDYEAPIFKNVNPRVYPLLDDLFHHTIGITVNNRFQNAEELISKLDEIIKLADPKEPYIKTNLPHPQGYFVGRDAEMEEIHRRLDENPVLFLSGVGGIGKSELAKRYAQKYQKEYAAIVFAPVVSDIDSMIYHVPMYNFDPYPQENPNDYLNRKWKKLKELANEDILMIVDNLDKADDPKLTDLLSFRCKILVTTRCDFSEYGYEQVRVDAISSLYEIKSIFHEYYKRPLGEEAKKCVDEIICVIGGHTMTVELLAKQMSAGRIVPEEMLERLQQGGIGESGKEKVRTVKDEQLSARSAYEHIKMLFDLSGLDKNERYILANLSLVPFTGISTELFHDLCELEDYDTINELVQTGWIRLNKEKDYISLHPVIADLAIDMVEESDIDISKLLNGLHELSENSDNGVSEFKSKKAFADFLYGVSVNVMKLKKETEAIAVFLSSAPMKYRKYGHLKYAASCCEKSLKIFIILFGEESYNVATAYNNLSSIYFYLGLKKRAVECATIALKIRQKVYGYNNGNTANSFNDLGNLYIGLGQYDKAQEYHLKALDIKEKIYGKEHASTASSYNNLGNLYHAQGQYDKAEKYLLKALDIKEKIYGKEHASTASSYNNLGNLYQAQGKFDKAELYLLNALDIKEKIYGKEHIDVALSYNNLGDLYRDQGQFDKAELYLLNALDIKEKIYGKENVSMASSYNNLGELYRAQGKLDKAELYLLKALDIEEKIYGKEHVSIALSYNNLGNLYHAQRQYDKAEKYLLKALDIKEKICGKEHVSTASSYNNLGILYETLNQFDKAELYHLKALDIKEKICGKEHVSTATSYNNLGKLYQYLGLYEKSEMFYIKALTIRRKFLNNDSLLVGRSELRLGKLYKDMQRFQDAKEHLGKAYKILKSSFGEDNEDAKTALQALRELEAKAE